MATVVAKQVIPDIIALKDSAAVCCLLGTADRIILVSAMFKAPTPAYKTTTKITYSTLPFCGTVKVINK